MPPIARTRRRGVVFIDVVMMLAVLGIVVVAIMPSARPSESVKLVAAATVLSADIEFAQSQTLAFPSDPTIIRFDEDGARYWLALASDPETPIYRPNGKDLYEVAFGEGAYQNMWGVTLEVQDLADVTLVFDAMGRLVQSEDGVVRFGSGIGELAVVVRAMTGSVSVVDGAQVPVGVESEPEPQPAPAPAPPPPGGPKGGFGGVTLG